MTSNIFKRKADPRVRFFYVLQCDVVGASTSYC